MAPSPLAQRRLHHLLLIQRLLSLKEGVGPVTLVLDSLEARGRGVVDEVMGRARISKTNIVYVSFETVRQPKGVDIFIRGSCSALPALHAEIAKHLPTPPTSKTPNASPQKTLLIIDTLNPLSSTAPSSLPSFLSSLLLPSVHIFAIYHTDIPLSPSPTDEYTPDPLTLLQYLSTAIIHVSSLHHAIERKKARDRSLQEPEWGLREGKEGVLVGLRGKREIEWVLDVEVRRKSGRGLRELFVLSSSSVSKNTGGEGGKLSVATARKAAEAAVCLLDDHPAYVQAGKIDIKGIPGGERGEGEEVETTFSLGLTEKQRRDREGVVLPYFDAQEGGGEGGRILYEMGREDDFDEEEDEI